MNRTFKFTNRTQTWNHQKFFYIGLPILNCAAGVNRMPGIFTGNTRDRIEQQPIQNWNTKTHIQEGPNHNLIFYQALIKLKVNISINRK